MKFFAVCLILALRLSLVSCGSSSFYSSSSLIPSQSIPLYPCGTPVHYNPRSNPSAPIGRAVSAGKYYDTTFSYVGLGNASCVGEPIVPARVSIGLKSGPHVTCGTEQFNNAGAAYIENHPNIRWVRASVANQSSIVGAIRYNGASYSYFYGRVNITYNGKVYQDVSKVHIGNNGKIPGLWYIPAPTATATEVNIQQGYDILVCHS